jgi:IS1 family transposase
MLTTEVCEYIMDLERKYREACRDRQEALEIFQDILLDDKAVKGDGWKVFEDRINYWINKIPHTHMISSKNSGDGTKV